MKKLLVILITLVLIFSCSKQEVFKLEKGSPAYELATQLAKRLPLLDPEKNIIVAETDQFVVTSGEVIYSLYSMFGKRAFQLASIPNDRLLEIIRANAENVAEKKLLLREAEKKGIDVDSTEVDSILQIQYARAGGKDAFLNLLSSHGFKMDELTRDIKENLKINKLITSIIDTIKVTDSELMAEYNEDKTATVRHILLSTQGKSDSEKVEIYKKMQKIRERAISGEDFAKLAKEYSEDPGSKDRGGLYENFSRGQMVKEFEDKAFNTPIGEISPIFETKFGYHILKVISRHKETKPFDAVKSEIEKEIRSKKENEILTAFLKKLKEESKFKLTI